jgi:exopolyphosphatase / guanosine-5'-triphosphate,3'-diphosphate pyrophosphatase
MEKPASRWEWRTFGDDFGAADSLFASMNPEATQESEETYLVTPFTDRTVKVRAGLMDIKLLEEVDESGLEQWRPVLKAEMPLSSGDVEEVYAALGVTVQVSGEKRYPLEDLVAELGSRRSDLRSVPVRKKRLRYILKGCMVEVTEVLAGGSRSRTIAIESPDPESVTSLVRELGLSHLPNTSYPRWLQATTGIEP